MTRWIEPQPIDVPDALKLDPSECALLAVLLLRGAQTPGELRARTDRYVPIESTEDVERLLGDKKVTKSLPQ